MYKIIKNTFTKEKNEISLIEIKNNNYDKTVLIIGVFHGEEPQGNFLINEYLKTDMQGIKNRLLIIPCLNPDGMKKNQRQNANGVDLNRNFPTKNWIKTQKNEYWGADEAGSEIETKFMTEILNEYKIDAILSIHAPFKIVNYDGPAKELAEKISEITGYKVQAEIGYPTPGSFGNYAGVERNIPTITLELPEDETNEQLWKTNKGVFDFLAKVF